ncbi:MAG: glycosyltransferase family 39 protein [Candidatus Omnitrophica bacterium]|nr:glycosyltransferase family 39 protein [Candidatus Omnitrophota bacterium]MBU4477589.1 glycosyltransferase family 39 protein [Candidatus Omnitrophota bacterium]MCG2703616.1 glycosyltransferase family 39 protein [Candidatus Omnitrophota bacterium]
MEQKSIKFSFIWPVLIFFASLVFGVLYILRIEKTDMFFYSFHAGTDMLTFYQQALRLYETSPGEFPLKMPLYSRCFLPLLFFLFGPNLFLVRIIQVVLASGSNVFIYNISKKVFNRPTAIIASVIAVLYPRFLIYQGVLLSETLAVFLMLVLFFFLHKFAEKKSYGVLSVLTFIWALLILTRPKFLIVSVFLIVWLCYVMHEDKGRLRRVLLIIVTGLILITGPRAIKNIYLNSGKLFLLCNSQYATPVISADSNRALNELAVEEGCTAEDARQDEAYSKAFNHIRGCPAKVLSLFAAKCLCFFSPTEDYYDNFPPRYYRMICPGLGFFPFSWGLIFPLGVIGAFLGFAYVRDKKLIYIMSIGYVSSVLMFQVADRYRLCLEPLLIIFAAFTIYYLSENYSRKSRRLFGFIGILLVAELLFNFQSIDKRLFMLFHSKGLVYRAHDKIVIRDTPARFSDLRYKAMLPAKEGQFIKRIFIAQDPATIRAAALLIDGCFLKKADLRITVNNTVSGIKWEFPDMAFPYLGTLALPLDPRNLKKGMNTIKIGSSTPADFSIFIDTRYDFNRSALFVPGKGISYYDLGSTSILGDGEYRIGIELYLGE